MDNKKEKIIELLKKEIKNIIKDIEKVEQNGMLSLGDMEKIMEKYHISLSQVMIIARYRKRYRRMIGE